MVTRKVETDTINCRWYDHNAWEENKLWESANKIIKVLWDEWIEPSMSFKHTQLQSENIMKKIIPKIIHENNMPIKHLQVHKLNKKMCPIFMITSKPNRPRKIK